MKDHSKLVGEVIDRRDVSYGINDTILYALTLGFGADPVDERQLRYVYEDHLEALPTLALIIGYAGFWMRKPEYGFDWAKVLHAEESFEIHNPLPVQGTLIGATVIEQVVDRGQDKGCFVYSLKELVGKDDRKPYASVTSNTLARGDGGFGGPSEARPPMPGVPERAADYVCDLPTLPQSALLYRLCGDMNPLHADPAVARSAGFEQPILHGRCTMGVAMHAVVRTCCDYDAGRIKSMQLRFSAPFLPGETLRTEMWNENGEIFFRGASLERGTVVLNNGRIRLHT